MANVVVACFFLSNKNHWSAAMVSARLVACVLALPFPVFSTGNSENSNCDECSLLDESSLLQTVKSVHQHDGNVVGKGEPNDVGDQAFPLEQGIHTIEGKMDEFREGIHQYLEARVAMPEDAKDEVENELEEKARSIAATLTDLADFHRKLLSRRQQKGQVNLLEQGTVEKGNNCKTDSDCGHFCSSDPVAFAVIRAKCDPSLKKCRCP